MKESIFDNLFKFPVLLTDKKRGILDKDEDYIVGEAELPYFEFTFIYDHWLPDKKELAEDGKFTACVVSFGPYGEFAVPMSKRAFKKQLEEFVIERKSIAKTKEMAVEEIQQDGEDNKG